NAKVSDKTLAGVVSTSTSGGFRSFFGNLFRRANGVTKTQLSADRDALESYYRLNGFSEVQIATPVVKTNIGGTMTVDFPIVEGPEIKVDQVIVRGNTYTNSNVVLKQASIDRGDPFSYTSTLEAQRNLYRLGIFNRVDIQPEQVGTSVADRNIVISVEEGKDLTVSGALGLPSQCRARPARRPFSARRLSPIATFSALAATSDSK